MPTINEQVRQHNDSKDIAIANSYNNNAAITNIKDKIEENQAILHGRGNKGGG